MVCKLRVEVSFPIILKGFPRRFCKGPKIFSMNFLKFHKITILGEALTFRATTTGVLSTLQHCVDLMSRETEQWQKD